MAYRYKIHPSIGVARVGNSPQGFYLAPETTGGRPSECDERGNPVLAGGAPKPVEHFKDDAGRIKRQAALFRVFRYDDARPSDPGTVITIENAAVAKIEWTVHLANKKACWYQFSELEGDLMLGTGKGKQNTNSYAARKVPLRNPDVKDENARRKLIIDPGPRTLAEPDGQVAFSVKNIPPTYTFGSFPPPPTQGTPITTLGEMRTDSNGQLLVLGGFGNAGGEETISSFAGGNTWHDDISDGPVACKLYLKSGEVIALSAWVIVGSPKFAPELVNIVTLDDIMFDVGVRYLSLLPEMYDREWNRNYVVDFQGDIEPIIRRPLDYIWVANVQSMMGFVAPPFDPRDASEANRVNRETFFSYFRKPGAAPGDSYNQLWRGAADSSIPLMPLQSGSNSVSNDLIDKFLTLTETQYFMLGQWAAGKFRVTADAPPTPRVHTLDRASTGNCVGGPMCPGIEVTWSLRNPPLYAEPYQIKQRFDETHYFKHGLSPTHDECEGGGCEPGDLTKRMAIPWQADFFQCTAQFVNYTDPQVNKENGIPAPPTYYAYWWPPQSPMFVLSGATSLAEQQAAGVPAGFQVYYPRGINSFAQMISGWSYLGFIVNQNQGPASRAYPYFVEKSATTAASPSRASRWARWTISSTATTRSSGRSGIWPRSCPPSGRWPACRACSGRSGARRAAHGATAAMIECDVAIAGGGPGRRRAHAPALLVAAGRAGRALGLRRPAHRRDCLAGARAAAGLPGGVGAIRGRRPPGGLQHRGGLGRPGRRHARLSVQRPGPRLASRSPTLRPDAGQGSGGGRRRPRNRHSRRAVRARRRGLEAQPGARRPGWRHDSGALRDRRERATGGAGAPARRPSGLRSPGRCYRLSLLRRRPRAACPHAGGGMLKRLVVLGAAAGRADGRRLDERHRPAARGARAHDRGLARAAGRGAAHPRAAGGRAPGRAAAPAAGLLAAADAGRRPRLGGGRRCRRGL
jgi:L-lysine 6-oxidase